MSSQPLALAIRLAAKQEEEQEAEAESGKRPAAASLEAQLAENAGLSSGKGGVEEGRGNLRFWLRDIKIAESLYTVSAPSCLMPSYRSGILSWLFPSSLADPLRLDQSERQASRGVHGPDEREPGPGLDQPAHPHHERRRRHVHDPAHRRHHAVRRGDLRREVPRHEGAEAETPPPRVRPSSAPAPSPPSPPRRARGRGAAGVHQL